MPSPPPVDDQERGVITPLQDFHCAVNAQGLAHPHNLRLSEQSFLFPILTYLALRFPIFALGVVSVIAVVIRRLGNDFQGHWDV